MFNKTIVHAVVAITVSAATVSAQLPTDATAKKTYVFNALTDFQDLDGGEVPYYKDKRNLTLAIRANIVEHRNQFAAVTRKFDGASGTYDVTITTLVEEDGESTYRILINGTVAGTFRNKNIGAGSALDMKPATHVWQSLRLNNGDTLSIESNTATNGEIPEAGGTAWARGRWRKIELNRVENKTLVRPPMDRQAIVADGNSQDPGAKQERKLAETLATINDRFEKVQVELLEWPAELQMRLGKLKNIAFVAKPTKMPAGRIPLLISLHGAGGKEMSIADQLERSARVKGLRLAELAGKNLILLEPNSADSWDADSLNAMLDYLLKTHPEIDDKRIYVMGHSMGGSGTWDWINESPERFAAAAPAGFSPGDTADLNRLVKLPIWGMVGGQDGDRVTGIRKMVQALRAAGNANVKLTEFPGANHSQGNAAVFSSVELVDWMLGFSR
jgi:dienelactone hydrolase